MSADGKHNAGPAGALTRETDCYRLPPMATAGCCRLPSVVCRPCGHPRLSPGAPSR